jgi:hypothetical protein
MSAICVYQESTLEQFRALQVPRNTFNSNK